MIASTNLKYRLASVLRVAPLIAVVLGFAVMTGTAEAQTPVDGPWMKMEQILCFTDPTCTNQSVLDSTDVEYKAQYGQKFEYGAERRRQCYYTDPKGPEAHEVNALYLMMACRVGIGVGAVTWTGTGIALMALVWVSFRRVIESIGGGNDSVSILRAFIDVPTGIVIMFMAFGLTALIYSFARYNFLRYLNPEWTSLP